MTLGRVLAEKRRILVPLALFIIANVVLYAVVIFPLGRHVRAAEEQARVQHLELNAARLDYQQAKATVTGKQQADSALQTFYKVTLPADKMTAQRLTYTRLDQLAKQANVKLEHGTNAVTQDKDSRLAKLKTDYTLTGEYRNVRKFIYLLETAPEFVVLENIGLTSGGDEQQVRGLGMSLEIATYFRSAGNGRR